MNDDTPRELDWEAQAALGALSLQAALRSFVLVFSPLMVLWALLATWLFPQLAVRAWTQTVVCVGTGLITWRLSRGKRPRAAVWFALIVALVTALLSAYTAGGVRAPAFATLPAIVVVGALLLGWTAAATMTAASIAVGGLLAWAELHGALPKSAAVLHPLWYWLASCVVLTIIATLQYMNARLARVNLARFAAARERRLAAELELRRSRDELLESHQRLEASEQRYRNIFDSADVALFEIDVHEIEEFRRRYEAEHPGLDLVAQLELEPALAAEILQCAQVRGGNDAARQLLDADDPSALRNDWRTLLTPAQHALVARLMLGAGGLSTQIELPVRTFKGRTRQIIATARTPEPTALDRVIVSALDVTEQRALEERTRTAERMDVLGRVAGGIAHDFNNALVVIMSWADLLRRPGRSEADRAQGLDAIVESAGRAAQLTRQLLSLGQRSVRTPRPTSVKAMIAETVRALSRVCPADIDVRVRSDEDLLVMVDEGQLQQVLLNLGLNARDAMPRGGVLSFEVRRAQSAELGDLPPSRLGYAEITVTDTGVGMDASTREHVFEPFFTTKQGKGTGLGLATAHAIVTQSHGSISVSSSPGRGSRFSVLLPLAEEVRAAGSAHRLEPLRAHGTVLVVDDEDPVRDVMVQALASAGFDVLSAADGSAALSLARSHRGSIDLLCTDGILPGVSSREVIDAFRALFPQSRVLVCSGHVEEELMRRRIAAGECEMLAKPFTPGELVRKAVELTSGPRVAQTVERNVGPKSLAR